MWDGNNKVCIRRPDGDVIEYGGKQVRIRLLKADGNVLEFRGDGVFLRQGYGSMIKYDQVDLLREEEGDVVEYRDGVVPYALRTFGGANPSDGVLVMNVFGGGLLGDVTSVNGGVVTHFSDIIGTRNIVNHNPCHLLVSMLPLVWWLGDSSVVVFASHEVHMRWAASTINIALNIAQVINQPVAIANRYVSSQSLFVVFVTEREFPVNFKARFVLLVSKDKDVAAVPTEFVKHRKCKEFHIFGRDGDDIPRNIKLLTNAITWINGL